MKSAVDQARERVEETCKSLSVCAAQYDRYGSNFIKNCGLRADALIQLAFQVQYIMMSSDSVPSSVSFGIRSHTIVCMES